MNVNDVFTVDQGAIDELKLEVTAGQQYRITQPVNGVEVRASKVVDGKPQKGRPRRFPVATVARLLGVPVPAVTATATATTETTETATEVVVDLVPGESEEISEEERAKGTAAVIRAIDPAGSQSGDW